MSFWPQVSDFQAAGEPKCESETNVLVRLPNYWFSLIISKGITNFQKLRIWLRGLISNVPKFLKRVDLEQNPTMYVYVINDPKHEARMF